MNRQPRQGWVTDVVVAMIVIGLAAIPAAACAGFAIRVFGWASGLW